MYCRQWNSLTLWDWLLFLSVHQNFQMVQMSDDNFAALAMYSSLLLEAFCLQSWFCPSTLWCPWSLISQSDPPFSCTTTKMHTASSSSGVKLSISRLIEKYARGKTIMGGRVRNLKNLLHAKNLSFLLKASIKCYWLAWRWLVQHQNLTPIIFSLYPTAPSVTPVRV